MVSDISRRDVLQGAVALGAIGSVGQARADDAQQAAISMQPNFQVNASMTYIGTPTSRYDGSAKVTGAAKYAGEFNMPGLAYGFVVQSTIARGRITRIDTSEALGVPGVIEVLTHENRPHMADNDAAYR